ncbi:MAG TPA: nucleotide sugar dehydrogenase [Solirubrobacteraceae bacterium]|nr:nucleotide sugar dehydrogenase [Solirubrobacteraceae bacterium]
MTGPSPLGIVGLGYVGLPLAVAFAQAGRDVIAVDVDEQRIAALVASSSYIEDVPSETLAAVAERLRPTTDAGLLAEADAVLICVPTPLSDNREPDLGPLMSANEAIAGVLRPGQLVVLESTTYPGTTRERLLPLLERGGLKAGSDFSLAYSPERVDPGRGDEAFRSTPKLVGGITPACTERAAALYREVFEHVVPVSSPEVAELAKLLENIFRSVNIALVNELAVLADRMKIDIWEVIDAAATKPFGFMRFEPGPGMGGHCLPVDPFYLTWRARQFDFATEFIELAGKINQQMPYFCLERIEHALNDASKPVRGSRITVLGVAYKGGVADVRESPALKIMALLAARGAELRYHDPHVAELPGLGLSSTPLEQAVEGADAVVVVTAHASVDHSQALRSAPLTIDLRGITRGLDLEGEVVRL